MKTAKYYYDQENGIFIKDDDISVNWLAGQILQKKNVQITKLSNEDIVRLVSILDSSDLRMPNGEHSLIWLKEQLREKAAMAGAKEGKVQYDLSERFKYIIQQIDMLVVSSKKERFEKQEVEKIKKINRTPNNMEIKFK
jgi:hypothetical protein